MSEEESPQEKKEPPIDDLPWADQKARMDALLLKLKTELKEVKATDKDLTKQFISLGGKINEVKAEKQRELEEEYEVMGDEVDGVEPSEEAVFADV